MCLLVTYSKLIIRSETRGLFGNIYSLKRSKSFMSGFKESNLIKSDIDSVSSSSIKSLISKKLL